MAAPEAHLKAHDALITHTPTSAASRTAAVASAVGLSAVASAAVWVATAPVKPLA